MARIFPMTGLAAARRQRQAIFAVSRPGKSYALVEIPSERAVPSAQEIAASPVTLDGHFAAHPTQTP